MSKFIEWLKKLFKRKQKQDLPPLPKIVKMEELGIEPRPEHVCKGIVTAISVQDVREQLDKIKEEQTKNQFLPKPKVYRKTRSHSYIPPAEHHRESISKFMKGKASSRYLKTIKQSPKIKIDED